MADGNKVTIYNLIQENVLKVNDFVPVSDGDTTRKLNLYDNLLSRDLHNIADISLEGTIKLVDTFIAFLHLNDADTGFNLITGETYSLKTSLYTINKKLPNNIVPEIIDYTRDIKISDTDIPVEFLGKEITLGGGSVLNDRTLFNQANIQRFDNPDEIKLYDYVKVLTDASKPVSPTYYILVDYNSKTGALNANSWKYIGFEDIYSKETVHDVLEEVVDKRVREDLLNIPFNDRREWEVVRETYNGDVIDSLADWMKSKTPENQYQGLYTLNKSGVTGVKGNMPETVTNLYAYNKEIDTGDSRFARKTLNNLRTNGEEQLYDATTDWGDNRFAHKALDNLKTATGVVEDYDKNLDYGNSRFARKNLNNLRSETLDILNDKVPSKVKVGSTSTNFFTNDNFAITNNAEDISFTFNKYVLNEVSPSATALKTDHNYTVSNMLITFTKALPDIESRSQTGHAGIVTTNQATKTFNSLISLNGFNSERTWSEYNTFVSELTESEREYYRKAWHRKIITTDETKGTVADISGLPSAENSVVGDKYYVNNENAYFYFDGLKWWKEGTKPHYVQNVETSDGNIVLTGYNIPMESDDWNEDKQEPVRGRSLSERISYLENLGTFLGTKDVNKGTYYIVDINNDSAISITSSGSGYEVNDIISVNTDVPGQTMYLKITDWAEEYTLAGGTGVPVVIYPNFGLTGLTSGSLFYTPHPLAEADDVHYVRTVENTSFLPESDDTINYYWVKSEREYYHYDDDSSSVTYQTWIPAPTYIYSHKVYGGSGAGMTLDIKAMANDGKPATVLPTNISEIPGATINDYMNVRFDPDHCGVPCRYYIKSIDNNGIITWELDIVLENTERNFVNEPIAHNELNNNAVHANNILNGTITTEKLAFSVTSTTELYSMTNATDARGQYILGNINFNDLMAKGNGTYIIRGSSSTFSPVYNTNLGLTVEDLSKMGISVSTYPTITDTSKWRLDQYFIKNIYGTIIGGYQQALNLYYPGMIFTRCIIPPSNPEGITDGVFPDITSTDYRNWSFNK